VKKTCTHKHTGKKQELASLTGRLRREARKITGPRAAILEILRHHPHPLTNKEIFAELPKGECDLATIYRAMQLLEKTGDGEAL
jgi:Fe2+ or Zn2+ uptake regulation protein